MPKPTAMMNYEKCRLERCDHGVCAAALQCEYGSLVQESPHQAPGINPAKWCHGCTKCARACPLRAITMI